MHIFAYVVSSIIVCVLTLALWHELYPRLHISRSYLCVCTAAHLWVSFSSYLICLFGIVIDDWMRENTNNYAYANRKRRRGRNRIKKRRRRRRRGGKREKKEREIKHETIPHDRRDIENRSWNRAVAMDRVFVMWLCMMSITSHYICKHRVYFGVYVYRLKWKEGIQNWIVIITRLRSAIMIVWKCSRYKATSWWILSRIRCTYGNIESNNTNRRDRANKKKHVHSNATQIRIIQTIAKPRIE